ncbi:MAG TPA: alpha/beta hydrolase fold domain-containing protein [Verrucomicrobiota bacterium]|nr:alpha/beta hydrolase fold domain-containing protein [Verrucomicrobiota bacterium]
MQLEIFHGRIRSVIIAGISLTLGVVALSQAAGDPAAHVPAAVPRTVVLAAQRDAFRAYCTTGDGTQAFNKIKADFDRDYLNLPFPAEPVTYGDPSPRERTSDKADLWRGAQDVCGRVSGVAEAATLLWLVTGDQKYADKAKEFLLKASDWHFNPDWKSGAVVGATDIYYNDEAHFRLWRKLPLVYDQLREQLAPAEKQKVLTHFKERGNRSVEWIKKAKIEQLRRNSIEVQPSSHPVRFMAMTGLTGLALWDDLPEAREWWRFAYVFYRDQFSPWGGDDGGWAEGNAYWRGTFEHAAFQDTLLSIGDPEAYSSEFWKNSPYFALYNVQPYLHTIFGDTSNAGRFNLDPNIADYMLHVARVFQNGYFRAYAELCNDDRPRPADRGLEALDRMYPTACEFLVRDFIVSGKSLPPPKPLGELPSDRYFRDVGWVSLHSSLGRPEDDIHITFKSSAYGSFSHSHADQNAFILNAFGEGLAINSSYREYHNSPIHNEWTRQTKSKNAILIDGKGQKAQDKTATGSITRFEKGGRFVWTTGDATIAYQTAQPAGRVQRVTRDLVFVDQRYVVIRDRVKLTTPGKLSWLLHAEKNPSWDEKADTASIQGAKAGLTAKLIAPGVKWNASVTDQFPVPVDPKYIKGEAGGSYITAKWSNQGHLTLESAAPSGEFNVFAVLWPERGRPVKLDAQLRDDHTLEVRRPDGKTDFVRVSDASCVVSDKLPPPAPAAANTDGARQTDATPTVGSTAETGDGEIVPASLPGAEAFVLRDLKPEPLRVHVFKPKNWKATDSRPALVFFFGGGWSRGTPEKSATWGKFAASLGMVGVCPDYRTINRFGTTPAEAVADARAAVRWVQDHAKELGVDPAKIAVGGNSAGGHLALWTAIETPPPGSVSSESPKPKPAALILMSAVSDTSVLSGYTPKRFGTNATALSPAHQLDKSMPPVLAFHGDADPTVPVRQALALRDALIASGNQCELILVPGGNHGFSSQFPEWKDKSRAIITEFLKTQGLTAK